MPNSKALVIMLELLGIARKIGWFLQYKTDVRSTDRCHAWISREQEKLISQKKPSDVDCWDPERRGQISCAYPAQSVGPLLSFLQITDDIFVLHLQTNSAADFVHSTIEWTGVDPFRTPRCWRGSYRINPHCKLPESLYFTYRPFIIFLIGLYFARHIAKPS